MTPPISIDGTDITGATIDGTDVQEITVDGDTVFTAGPDIPDSGLLHFWTAKEVSASDGDPISTLTDQEGTEDLTQATGGDQPTYKTGIINGNPILRFDTDNMRVSFGSTVTQPFEIFLVGQYRNVSGRNQYAYDGFNNQVAFLARDLGNENEWAIFSTSASTIIGSGTSFNTNPHLWTSRFDGGSSFIRLDESEIASGNAGTGDLDGFTLGSRNDTRSDRSADIDFGAAAVYDPSASGYSRTDIESYFIDEWGPF